MLSTPLYDITPFSTLDYPDHLAAIFWFGGCNMRCDYCYNKDVVLGTGHIGTKEALAFLKQRIGLLDAVVLSGGEATLYNDITTFARQIKTLGFKIKLDTNGTACDIIQELLEQSLIDYIALDYKAPETKFTRITHHKTFQTFQKTLTLLIGSNLPFEVRTTLHTDLLDEYDINAIIEDLHVKGYNGIYYIQNFFDTHQTIGEMASPTKPFDRRKVCPLLHVKFRH